MTVGMSAGAPECAEWSREVRGERRKQGATEGSPRKRRLFGVAVETRVRGVSPKGVELKLPELRL